MYTNDGKNNYAYNSMLLQLWKKMKPIFVMVSFVINGSI